MLGILVRTRYKFTLCFYHDCYYFLIKRYCTAAVLARANDVERRVNEAVRLLLLHLRSGTRSYLPLS